MTSQTDDEPDGSLAAEPGDDAADRRAELIAAAQARWIDGLTDCCRRPTGARSPPPTRRPPSRPHRRPDRRNPPRRPPAMTWPRGRRPAWPTGPAPARARSGLEPLQQGLVLRPQLLGEVAAEGGEVLAGQGRFLLPRVG